MQCCSSRATPLPAHQVSVYKVEPVHKVRVSAHIILREIVDLLASGAVRVAVVAGYRIHSKSLYKAYPVYKVSIIIPVNPKLNFGATCEDPQLANLQGRWRSRAVPADFPICGTRSAEAPGRDVGRRTFSLQLLTGPWNDANSLLGSFRFCRLRILPSSFPIKRAMDACKFSLVS